MKPNIKFKKQRPARKNGFTLVEVLVATLILAIGVLAVSQLTVMGVRASTVMNRRMYARDILNRHHERLMALPTTDSILQYRSSSSLDDTIGSDYSIYVQSHGGQYRVIWNIADSMISATPDNRFKTIRVMIMWPQTRRPLTSDLIRRY